MNPHRVVGIARVGAVVSGCAMWIAAGVTASAVGMVSGADSASTVSHEQVTIGLPVFIVSIISTAIFTWTIARYDMARNVRIRAMEKRLDRLLEDREIHRTP